MNYIIFPFVDSVKLINITFAMFITPWRYDYVSLIKLTHLRGLLAFYYLMEP